MRVDYRPLPGPHVCKLPAPEAHLVGTLLTCTDVVAYVFNGHTLQPRTCNLQYQRGVTAWRRRPTWIRCGRDW